MITISLCMILKDEEDVLDRCLSSVKGLVDEIIIVDTGSTDATKQIALHIQTRFLILPGLTTLPLLEIMLFLKQIWNIVCGWMRTM